MHKPSSDGVRLLADGPAILNARRDRMTRAGFGDGGNSLGLMDTLVPGARSSNDCVKSGWPRWLIESSMSMYTTDSDSEDQLTDALEFAARLAAILSSALDLKSARKALSIRLLSRVESIDHTHAVRTATWALTEGLDDDAMDRTAASISRMRKESQSAPAERHAVMCALEVVRNNTDDALLRAAFALTAKQGTDPTFEQPVDTVPVPRRALSNLRTDLLNALSDSQTEERA